MDANSNWIKEAEDEINLEDQVSTKEEGAAKETINNVTDADVPTLTEAILDCQRVMDMFFNNQFNEALMLCEQHAHHSMYHSIGKSFLMFLFGIINLEPPEMKAAKDQVKSTQTLIDSKRRPTTLLESVSSLIWKPNYDDYTDEESHAELMYAELQVMHALLSIFGDQNFVSMIKGAFRIRSANASYKTCAEIVANKRCWESDVSRANFESGFLMGNGTLNLILSHLPSRVLKLLTLVGFSGSYEVALRDLHIITTDAHVSMIRYRVSQIIIVLYSLYMEIIFGVGNHDNQGWAEDYQGAIPLLFAGRLKVTKGYQSEAIEYFLKCINVTSDWKTLKNVCYWDLSWCYAKSMDWMNGSKYAMILKEECNWSPASNMYQYACYLGMELYGKKKKLSEVVGDKELETEISDLRNEINESMRMVPELKVRFAGKTIPTEKFAITKAIRYNNNNSSFNDDITPLPALELFYIWNMFSHSSESNTFLIPFQSLVDELLEEHIKDLDDETEQLDSYCLLMLLKGVILRYMNDPLSSIECLMNVLKYSNRIKDDHYLPPHAAVELGLSYARAGKWEEAKSWLEKARTDYTGFLIESLVHVRVHGALMSIQRLESKDKDDSDDVFVNYTNKLSRNNSTRSSQSRKSSSNSIKLKLSRKSSSASNHDTKL